MNDQTATPASGARSQRALAHALLVVFMLVLAFPGLLQVAAELCAHRRGTRQEAWPTLVEIVRVPGRAAESVEPAHSWPRRLWLIASAMAPAQRAAETKLEDTSPAARHLRPVIQRLLTRVLRAGNARVVVGRSGFLFFRPAVEHLTGPSFLSPRQLELRRRAASGPTEPDPRPAILQLNAKLAARGITLVLLPVPAKASIHPEKVSGRLSGSAEVVDNPSTRELFAELTAAGVLVFDPTPALLEIAAKAPAYLAADTHWRPESMAAVAKRLAAFLEEHVALPGAGGPKDEKERVAVTNRGDLAAMLELEAGAERPGTETVQVEQVIGEGDLLWRLDTSADVLLLGDSFTNVFSLGSMGWGEAGGLAEHLGLELGRPVDTITRNDSGAWATRSLLAQELARGRDRLAGKRVVVWEFAAREFSLGDWRHIPLEVGTARDEGFFVPVPGTSAEATGTIVAMGVVPRPRSAPYSDYIVALHLQELTGDPQSVTGSQALVFVLAMKDYELSPAASYRVGQRVTLTLQRWSDVATQYELINRGELLEGGLMMQEPCWGEEDGS